MLPEEVLKEAADEMLDYRGSGMSVMEMSHRSKVYDNIIKEAEQDLRDLMNIPDNYKVLFLQGGQRVVLPLTGIRFFLKFPDTPLINPVLYLLYIWLLLVLRQLALSFQLPL